MYCLLLHLLLVVAATHSSARLTHHRPASYGCADSHKDTEGFFCLTDSLWSEAKSGALHQYALNFELITSQDLVRFWRENHVPELSCPVDERVGRRSDGGKWLCQPHLLERKCLPPKPGPPCLIYSFGSNNEFSFEAELLHRAPCCNIHVFDYTSRPPKPPLPNLDFHRWGLAVTNRGKMKSIDTIRQQLHHSDRPVDVVKMDVEGAEFDWFESELAKPVSTSFLSYVRLLLVEFHVISEEHQKRWHGIMVGLHALGFASVHRELNMFGPVCMEYALVRLRQDFFSGNGTTR